MAVPSLLLWLSLLALVVILTWVSTLNLALGVPSRGRIRRAFEEAGRDEALELFVRFRTRFLLATSSVRALASLGMLLLCMGICASWFEQRSVVHLVAFLMTLVLVLVFSVAIPHAWAKYAGEVLLVRLLPVLTTLRFITAPILTLLDFLDPLVRRLCGVPIRDAASYADELEQEVLSAVKEMERHGAVDEEEKEMIESVIELRATLVEEIMTPRTEIVAIPRGADLQTIKEVIKEKGHSRIPIYDETIDTILGMLYAKDLLHLEKEEAFDIEEIKRKVSFIPETKPVRDLLHEFQVERVHVAIVLDEYGGTAGLVTIEDILEELVGEIADEYEEASPALIKRIDENIVEVDARLGIEELNDELDLHMPEDEDYETIGGFVFSTLGKIPKVGEECTYGNVALQVIAAEPNRIRRLRLHITPRAEHNGRTGD